MSLLVRAACASSAPETGSRAPRPCVKPAFAPDVAGALSQALAKAEQAVPAHGLAMFAKFEGLVRMDEVGNHPAVHDHAAQDHKH